MRYWPIAGRHTWRPLASRNKVGVPPARLELTTPGLGILCSILLSYGGVWGSLHGVRKHAQGPSRSREGDF